MPGPMFLRGAHVDLHVIEEEDLSFLQELVNHPSIWRSLSHAGPITMDEERSFYENVLQADEQEHFLICDDGEAVGIVGMADIDPDWGVAELGYFVDPNAQKRGYATAAVGLITEYAFDERRLKKLFAHVIANNEPSRRVLENNGFEREGRLREFAFVDGERQDLLVFGLLGRER